MKKSFTIGGVFKEARAIVNPKLWKVVLQFALLLVSFMLLSSFAQKNTLLGLIISALLSFCIILFALGYVRRDTFSFDDFMQTASWSMFGYFIAAYSLKTLFTLGGYILLIIPGIMLSVWLCFTTFIAVEREIGPWEACRESARLTRGYRWKILGFFLVALLFNIIGAICLVVGLFYTIPVTILAFGLIYKKLSAKDDTTTETIEIVEIDIIEAVPETV
jgi:uncharacterized membrane protein